MSANRPISVLFVASEVAGFAKTGGLADVAASLPRALARRGLLIGVVLPLYAAVRRGPHQLTPTGIEFTIALGHRPLHGRVVRSTLPGSNVPVYLIEQPELFERDDPARGWGIYQYSAASGSKQDYPDNAERYVFLCRAVMTLLPRLDPAAAILHCNDWQTGLLPAYLRASGDHGRRSLLTIHNIAYQGHFPAGTMAITDLPWHLFHSGQLEFGGGLNFLKAGCVFADAINTVSPRYAREIQTPEFGCGLEGVLATRRHDLCGIVNGVDYGEWDPSIDRHIVQRFDATTVFDHKPVNKQALQRELGLPERADAPLLAVVARLVDQKGVGLILQALPALFEADVQLAILGEGDPHTHYLLREWQGRVPHKFGLRLGFDEGLAHRIEAGADVFLMPSRYEPSGLNQLYSLRYGTVPVVREVGGLADTIVDARSDTIAAGTATGFLFGPYDSGALLEALVRALACWQNDRSTWRRLMQTGMRQDWSWDRSAADYERVYARLLELPPR